LAFTFVNMAYRERFIPRKLDVAPSGNIMTYSFAEG